MKAGIQIEIHYRYSNVDKTHEYSNVCRELSQTGYSRNCWIFWLWHKMGSQFTPKEMKQFKILPFANNWDENSKLIKEYKTVNTGVDMVIPAIRKHFLKIKNK